MPHRDGYLFVLLLSKCEHGVDTGKCFFTNLIRENNFFSCGSLDTIVYIGKCCKLHIGADTILGKLIEVLIRTLKLQML